jgi:hypothetical protein
MGSNATALPVKGLVIEPERLAFNVRGVRVILIGGSANTIHE